MAFGLAVTVLGASSLAACGTEPLGDNPVPPDPSIDEDFFFCRIQPEIIATHNCASGGAGEGGSCHTARSALRLDPAGESDPPPACDEEGVLLEAPPESYENNLESVRFTIRAEPLSSPFYQRPVGIASHPRVIFEPSSTEADLIVEWLTRGAP
ncbi:MAG TPA: hypothetical protein RMH85_19145 [Polyangiaceae bacterium LLY-WYZ-15_(1-7)]|nr:hypothetical protein [Sandaracinus sp.]HJK93703.1 hypothetical protein [Polyangiaceae bacterium LLY-WYZ-15_(1-7)]MBJ69875.1 hypothetical protein [Sandaracinus sp.]HJL03355.1 hypothetical protein [Polyangiaceae bacterium LLY-WYZ-15_(1-7)]HJL10626.1 hypothetical protein [Polyangiaceae bacterium LLY-WYZ-15_(1-7)]